MKNSFGMGPMNPLTIAGFNMMQGVPMGKALSEAAMMSREQQLADAHVAEIDRRNQEAARAQILQQQLPEVIRQMNPGNMQEVIAQLIARGADAPMLNAITNHVMPQGVPDPVYGGLRNPYTGAPLGEGQMQGMPQMQGSGGTNMYPQNSIAGTPKALMDDLQRKRELDNKKLLKQDEKLDEISERANEASSQLSTINTLEGLMKKFTSGPISGGLYHQHIGSYFGDKNTAAAKSFHKLATQAFTLATSKEMKGAQSDKDMGLIIGSQISLDSDPRTNQNLLNVYKAEAQRYNQYADAVKQWTDAGGDLKDFDRRWRKYVNAFPLINESNNGNLVINQDNLKNADLIFDQNFDNVIAAYNNDFDENMPITQTGPQTKNVDPIKQKYGYTREELERIARGK